MNNRVNKLKRQMEERRRKRKITSQKPHVRERLRGGEPVPISWRHDEEREEPLFTSWDSSRAKTLSEASENSYFRKDRILMQILASICLFIGIGIVFQSPSTSFEGVRSYVHKSFHEDFQFGAVATWYEDLFGRPLALLPQDMDVVAPDNLERENDVYALPANGVVRQTFEQNGRGIYVETDVKEPVEAVRSGMVRFVGEDDKQEWGKVVVIKHYDGGESWYGMLDNISVQLFDHVESGETIGEVTPHHDLESVGIYYFALKLDDTFVDPIEVISID